MLSLDTVHAVTDGLTHLLHDDAITSCWATAATLSLLHDYPAGDARGDQRRELTTDSFTVICDGTAQHHGRLPEVLDRIATLLRERTTDRVAARRVTTAVDVAALTRLLGRGPQLLACAVFYHDVLADDATVQRVRRVDAVDTDARTYHLTLLPQQRVPVVVIDDGPDRGHLPATRTALSALLRAATAASIGATRGPHTARA